MSEEIDEKARFNPGRPELGEPLPPEQWSKPWAQLKFVSFQPAIFPRMLGDASRDARPGDLVSVYDKFGHRVGTGPSTRAPRCRCESLPTPANPSARNISRWPSAGPSRCARTCSSSTR